MHFFHVSFNRWDDAADTDMGGGGGGWRRCYLSQKSTFASETGFESSCL